MKNGKEEKIDLAFLFIGGVHHVLHLAPVAVEVSRRRPDLSVHCICGDADTSAALRAVAGASCPVRITEMRTSLLSRAMMAVTGRKSAGKGPLLAAIRWRTRGARAIIVPERTSAKLRMMGWSRPLIHFRHGAGDRAPASEARLRAFDLIIVPGEKDIERAVARGIDPGRLRTAGYVKLDYLESEPGPGAPLFDNRLRTVFYNPHFDARTSSIGVAREVIARFRSQDRYNLVFAPHVRAVEDLSAGEKRALEDLAVPGRIHVDLGSPGLFDMRYVRGADLYLGDMSSQLYEFLVRPRPVAFINSHGVSWRDDPRYAGWHLGEVAEGVAGLIDTVDRAFAGHAQKVALQQQAVAFAFGDYRGATGRAANILLEYLAQDTRCAA